MRDGWFKHDSLGLATKTHPCVSDGTAKRCLGQTALNYPFSVFSVCHFMHNWNFSIVVGGNHKGNFLRWIVTCWPLAKYILRYFSLHRRSLDFVSFFVCERGEALFFVAIPLFMHRPPLAHLYNLTNAHSYPSFFPSHSLRSIGRRLDTLWLPLYLSRTRIYTHIQSTSAGLRDNAAHV